MVSNFTRESPVLDYGPKSHSRWEKREFILWPALAYRVVVPQVRRRALNLFQRAALGLCRTGIVTCDQIGEKLEIDTEMAAFVVSELIDTGFLDNNGIVTNKGIEALRNDSFEIGDMEAGYVFRDPYTGRLWPRFVNGLRYAELQ